MDYSLSDCLHLMCSDWKWDAGATAIYTKEENEEKSLKNQEILL